MVFEEVCVDLEVFQGLPIDVQPLLFYQEESAVLVRHLV